MSSPPAAVLVDEFLFEQPNCDRLFNAVYEKVASGEKDIVIDFSKCKAVSAYGLSQLIMCRDNAKGREALISLINLNKELTELFKNLTLDKVFKF